MNAFLVSAVALVVVHISPRSVLIVRITASPGVLVAIQWVVLGTLKLSRSGKEVDRLINFPGATVNSSVSVS